MNYSCFKAYDVRGRVPDELNNEIAYRIGRAFVKFLDAKKVCVGHDIRLTSLSLSDSLKKGIIDSGADVIDIGMCGTEEIYFATFNNDVDGGIVVTASHNPMDYNGMKFVKRGSLPISGDNGLFEIKSIAEAGDFAKINNKGSISSLDSRPAYIKHLLSYIDIGSLEGLRIACNAGNGGAGIVIDELEKVLPVEFLKIHNTPDGNFPNGIPNPLLIENRKPTIDAVRSFNAQMGIAWDGDFDRCFFFDENGSYIEGYYIVGLLAEAFLQKKSHQCIVHDPRLTWNTVEITQKLKGRPVMSKTGHAFMKEKMREEDAVYGGEMSAHHYFRDFAYCDSGMIPWLLIAELMVKKKRSLSSLVSEMISNYPVSGEINHIVSDPDMIIENILDDYKDQAVDIDYTDGLSMSFLNWRFSLRKSNTEPLLRLNVESRNNETLMKEKTEELLKKIN